jgi:hypothetical protein
VLLVGLGGTQAEAMNDVRLLPAGASADRVIQELGKLKGAALLRGFRGSPPLDVESAARIVCRLGAFLLAHPTVREVDLNPVILHPAGRGATAVDALIVVGQ